jgi:uncharacterized membrane protein
MSQFLIAASTWLHALATVIFIGHYVLLALVYLPAVQDVPEEARGAIVSAISKRSRSWLYISLGVFAVTGLYLMLVDPNYLGIGRFNNAWSVAMLLKHLIVLAMLGLGFWFNAILRIGPLASSNTGGAQAMARFGSHVNTMAVLGAAVLLLTAMSQVL